MPTAAAFFGGNVAVRTMNTLLIGAIKLLSGGQLNAANFRTEAEARAWLDQERQRLQGTSK